MHRYYPRIPNEQGVLWEEFETLGNHAIVEVSGQDVALDTIRADSEFMEIPPIAAQRAAFRNKLFSLGWKPLEVNGTNLAALALVELLASATGNVRPNAARTAWEIDPGRRRPPKEIRTR